jgi:TRAP-type C4-dicarboxylate transport system substrate-binding protein
MISASRKWWDKLSPATQGALEKLIAETIQVQKELNWCVDKLTYEKYGTKDPSKPGVYWMTPQEVSALTGELGDGPMKWVKSKTPQAASKWVDTFRKEGEELSKQNPPGSSWIEKVDCAKHASKIVIK